MSIAHVCMEAEEEALVLTLTHQEVVLSYPDLAGRAARYGSKSVLPLVFTDGDRFPTHVAAAWTVGALIDILAQTLQPPACVPRDGAQAFDVNHIPRTCMRAQVGWVTSTQHECVRGCVGVCVCVRGAAG